MSAASDWSARFRAAASPGSVWPWIAVAALAVLTHLAALSNPFVYDDWYNIQENPYMHHPQAWRKMFSGNVWEFLGRVGIGNYYRPLMHVFHYGIYQLFGEDPGWFHLFCVLLHGGVSLMVMVVVRRFSGSFAIGALAGLLFAVHPLHTEVLAWISCSPELRSSFFSLLAIALYLRTAETAGWRRALRVAAMAAWVLLAEPSKEIGVVAPVVIVMYELVVRRRGPIAQLRERLPEYIALAAAALVALGNRLGARRAAAVALVILTAYTARSAVRMGDWNDEVRLFDEGLARSRGFFHIHSFRGEILIRHNRPAEAVASIERALQLREDYGDAHNYLGRAYSMLGETDAALRHYRRAADLSMRDGRPDSASRSWNNIGVVYRSLGRLPEAIASYRRALSLDPEFAAARNNLGYALLLEGQVEEAVSELLAAVREDATLGQAHANLGLAYAMGRRWEDARHALAEAERLAPDNPEVHARLGEVYLAQGNRAAARREFLRALRLDPANERARAALRAAGSAEDRQ